MGRYDEVVDARGERRSYLKVVVGGKEERERGREKGGFKSLSAFSFSPPSDCSSSLDDILRYLGSDRGLIHNSLCFP